MRIELNKTFKIFMEEFRKRLDLAAEIFENIQPMIR